MVRASLVLLVVLVTAGCGAGADPAPTPGSTSPPADAWLAQVCTGLAPARTTTGPPGSIPGDPAASRRLMLAWLDGRVYGVSQAADRVTAAGPAPVGDGQRSTAVAVDLLRQRQATLTRQREDLAAVPEADAAAVGRELQRVRDGAVTTSAATLRDIALPAALTDEAADVPACAGLR